MRFRRREVTYSLPPLQRQLLRLTYEIAKSLITAPGSNLLGNYPSSGTDGHGYDNDAVERRSWLRDNALTEPTTVHDPVNVVRHGRSEQFFPVGRSGAASESSWRMPGKVWLEIGMQWGLHTHALIAASNALVPMIFMTRVRL